MREGREGRPVLEARPCAGRRIDDVAAPFDATCRAHRDKQSMLSDSGGFFNQLEWGADAGVRGLAGSDNR